MSGSYHVIHHPHELGIDGRELHAASFVELPGCIAQGATAAEAEQALWAVLPHYLERLHGAGLEPPAPSRPPVTQAVVFGTTRFVGLSKPDSLVGGLGIQVAPAT